MPFDLPLNRLLAPRSIATFGGVWAERVIEQCRKMGFAGEIWPVHPVKDTLGGLRCYRTLADLPRAPDASFVAVNRNLAVEVIAGLSTIGAGGAICFASGFKESGPDGAELEAALIRAAGDMPFLGPNCYGLINYVDGAPIWPDQHGGLRTQRGVAILMQSGNIAINVTMNRRAVPIAYLAALGNQAKIGLADLTRALAATGRVSAIGMLIEGIADPAAFAEAVAVARRDHGVPVVALKAGHSDGGRELAMSHTGSLAGSDTVMDAFLARLGVARVFSLPDFLETLKLLHVHGPLPGKTLVSLSCSGGEALLMADGADDKDVTFRPFTQSEIDSIRPTVNPIVTVSNPFDYHTFDWANRGRLEATFTQVLASKFDLGLIVMDIPRTDRCDGAEWRLGIEAFAAAARVTHSKIGVLSTLTEGMPEDYAKDLMAAGIVPLMGIEEALTAVARAAFVGRTAPDLPCLKPFAAGGAGIAVSEWDAKQQLAAAGLSIPDGRLVATPAQAMAALDELGAPVVVKACSAALAHKTEAGGVRLNLRNGDEVAAAVGAMVHLADRFIVERMVTDAVAELIIGIKRDLQLGPVLIIGSGGILVELVGDTRTLLLPITAGQAEIAIRSLKAGRLIEGFRGRPKGDLAAAVNAVLAVARFALAHWETLVELDINPLIVRADGLGAVAADALLVRMAHWPSAAMDT